MFAEHFYADEAGIPQIGGARILLVDDEPRLCDSIRQLFELRGYDGHMCTSGTEAIATLKLETFDLILLDLMLPDMTGHDVLGVRPKGQIRLAVQIDGGWERNNWRVPSSGGIDPVDTTGVLQASIDSLKALGIPIAVMVNCDSLNQYPNDKSWWARNPNFVYEVYDAISTASAPASYALYKNQLAGFYASMDSCFGRSRVDRVFTGYEGDD